MSEIRHFRLGLFVLGGLGALLGLLILLGVGSLFRSSITMETYIDGSVQGLDVGAPVKFRGVTIGDVTRIGFTSSVYQADAPATDRRRYVMVEARLRPDRFVAPGRDTFVQEDVFGRLVENGLRVRMAAQGITGINYLELDFVDPEGSSALEIDWEPENLYVPSAPSIAVQFLEYADNILQRIDALDIEGVVTGLSGVLASLDRSLQDLDTGELNANVNASLEELTRVMSRVESVLGDPDFRALPGETRAMLESTRRTMDSLDLEGLAAQLEALVGNANRGVASSEQQLEAILGEVRQTSSALRGLTEDIRRDPARVLRSAPPQRSLIDPTSP